MYAEPDVPVMLPELPDPAAPLAPELDPAEPDVPAVDPLAPDVEPPDAEEEPELLPPICALRRMNPPLPLVELLAVEPLPPAEEPEPLPDVPLPEVPIAPPASPDRARQPTIVTLCAADACEPLPPAADFWSDVPPPHAIVKAA